MSVAARVAQEKREHPERFCAKPGCLWRVRSVRTFGVTPCCKHGVTFVPQHPAQEENRESA